MDKPNRKVCFHTLGCKLNYSESSTLARQFEQGGYIRTTDSSTADIHVINSCSVTEHADKKCRNLIGHLHRITPNAIIAVTGCYAQLNPERLAAVEGVDIVLSNNHKGELFERVSRLSHKGSSEFTSCTTEELTNFFAAFSSGDRTRAFLKVQDGCDYCCSYCTIHTARGSSRNIAIEQIIAEAKAIAAAGQKEIVITGVNTGDFGRTTNERFIDLLRALDGVEGIERYRISSIEPNLLTDEIIEFCASSAKFQPHFHIPIQSGSNNILHAMRRRYTVEKFLERINAVRRLMPDSFIGIDVIVGFPGESDEDFEETYRFLESISPAYLHVFPFSEREGTDAATMSNKVRDSIKSQRAQRLGSLCDSLHRSFYEAHENQIDKVLFEGSCKGGMMHGYTGNYIKVVVPFSADKINQIVDVRLVKTDERCQMIGKIEE